MVFLCALQASKKQYDVLHCSPSHCFDLYTACEFQIRVLWPGDPELESMDGGAFASWLRETANQHVGDHKVNLSYSAHRLSSSISFTYNFVFCLNAAWDDNAASIIAVQSSQGPLINASWLPSDKNTWG